jgi:hypothetical protein
MQVLSKNKGGKIMKKVKLFILTMLIISTLVGCSDKQDIKSIFIEPEGYVISEIESSGGLFSCDYYGYIKESDIDLFTKGELKTIKVLNPYEKDKFVLVNADEVKHIKTGEYKDIR